MRMYYQSRGTGPYLMYKNCILTYVLSSMQAINYPVESGFRSLRRAEDSELGTFPIETILTMLTGFWVGCQTGLGSPCGVHIVLNGVNYKEPT